MRFLLVISALLAAASAHNHTGHGHSLYGACPPGWISMSESLGCLLFHTEACAEGCGWLEAMESCQREDAWLLEVHTLDQQDFVVKMAKALEVLNGPLDWWVGLTDLGHE